jgi:hypothetical protein
MLLLRRRFIMESSDYLKYMTEKVVTYLDKDNQTEEQEESVKKKREPWLTRWFGVIPMGIMMWWGHKGFKGEEKEQSLSVK